jgi:hypothetical protein
MIDLERMQEIDNILLNNLKNTTTIVAYLDSIDEYNRLDNLRIQGMRLMVKMNIGLEELKEWNQWKHQK